LPAVFLKKSAAAGKLVTVVTVAKVVRLGGVERLSEIAQVGQRLPPDEFAESRKKMDQKT
jgi:hypothetical protein